MTLPHPYRRIACFVDESDDDLAREVVAAGLRLRFDERVKLYVVYVAPDSAVLRGGFSGWEVDEEDPFRPVRNWLAGITAGDGVEAVVLSGREPVDVALRWSSEVGVDLHVAAAAKTRLQRRVLGSFVEGLARNTKVPTLVFPPEVEVRDPMPDDGESLAPPGNIACCIDGSPAAAAALEESRRILGSQEGGRLTAIHAVIPPRPARLRALTRLLPAPRAAVRRGREWLAGQQADLGDARGVLVTGHPRDVSSWAARHDIELLVCGSRAGGVGARTIGSFAHQLCRHAEVPVLLVPPEAAD